jgi:hypothetical protein
MIRLNGTDIVSAVEKVHITLEGVSLTLNNDFDTCLIDAVLYPIFINEEVVDLHMHRGNMQSALKVTLPEYQPLGGPIGELTVIKIKLKVVAA